MEYKSVPKMISCKDLDYLSDMFNWNYSLYKNMINAVDMIEDENIKEILERASDMSYNNMNSIIDILNKEVDNG